MLAHAPVGKSEEELEALLTYCTHYAARRTVPLNVDVPTKTPRGFSHFEAICKLYSTLDLYLWLQVRYPEHFTEKELCLEQKEIVLQHIDQYLQRKQGGGQEYTHLITYRKIRERMSGKLPAAEHQHILESTLQHMDSVKDHELVITRKEKHANSPRDRDRDHRQGRGQSRDGGRGGGRGRSRVDPREDWDWEGRKRSRGKNEDRRGRN